MTYEYRKRILFLSATRAEFGKMKSVITRVRESGDFDFKLFVTGMHMLTRYGSTYKEIYRAGFSSDDVFLYINQDGAVSTQMDIVLASTIQGIGLFVREYRPDLIVVHGDRLEALAGAVVGALNNILVAHVEGGEISGTVDEIMRHAISKLAHLHLVYNETARRRLIQMGELPETIHVIGAPGLDTMLSANLPMLSDVRARYEIDFERYGIFIYHAVTTELTTLHRQVDEVVSALELSNLDFVVIHPNNDNGVDIINHGLNRLRSISRFRFLPSMRFEHYLVLLKNAVVIVGNSSSGIHEAPVYGIPTVNIGTRQSNRTHYPSILNVPEERSAILDALRNLPTNIQPARHFGTGNSADLFMALLLDSKFWSVPHQKQFRDISI